MPATISTCEVYGTVFDAFGQPTIGVKVGVMAVYKNGALILQATREVESDAAGFFTMDLPRDSTAVIYANTPWLNVSCLGTPLTIPDADSAELVYLAPADPEAIKALPPLLYAAGVLSIPRASVTQDGYLSAEDFALFSQGGNVGTVTEIDTGAGLTGGPITDEGTIALATIPGVAGTYPNPTNIVVNAQGQIISITSGAPDTTPPTIALGSPTSLTATSVTINWTTNEPADSRVDYSIDTSYGTSTPPADTATPVLNHHVSISGLAPSTLYHYRVKSNDTAGNPATAVTSTFTTTAVVDTTPPVISAVTATSITDTGATITWTTDEAGDSLVEYSPDPDTSFGTSTGISDPVPPGVTSHSVPLAVLTPSHLYHYRVKSKDAAGNPAIPVTGTFTTHAPPGPDLLTGLVSMWQLGEAGTANRIDSVGSNDLGAGSGITSVAGKIGNATHFPGVTGASSLTIPDNASLQTGDIDYTVAFWVRLDNKDADEDFVGKNGGFNFDEYIIGYQPPATSDRFRFTVCGGAPVVYTTLLSTSLGSPSIGTWYLIVCWHDTTAGKIYMQVNNGAIDEAIRIEPMFAGTAPFNVGIYNNAGGDLNRLVGTVDEIAFWKNRVLDATARTALWNGSAGLPFSNWT